MHETSSIPTLRAWLLFACIDRERRRLCLERGQRRAPAGNGRRCAAGRQSHVGRGGSGASSARAGVVRALRRPSADCPGRGRHARGRPGGSTPNPSAARRRCIDANRALTASHCLAPAERHAGASCARTWIAFPQTADAPAEWIACARVVAATETVDESALHEEHAVLQLARASARAPLAIDPSPPEPGSIVMVVSVTPHPIYGSTHALSTRLCRAIDSTPAQGELGNSAANVGWLLELSDRARQLRGLPCSMIAAIFARSCTAAPRSARRSA